MKFSTDQLMLLFKVCTGLSKHLDGVQAGKEIVITRHGMPAGALLAAARLFQYYEHKRVMRHLLTLLKSTTPKVKLITVHFSVERKVEQLLTKPIKRSSAIIVTRIHLNSAKPMPVVSM